MVVSADDRRRWHRQIAALRQFENDDEGSAEWRQAVEEAANARRAEKGIPPLDEWWEDKTEHHFHELARAKRLLGRVR